MEWKLDSDGAVPIQAEKNLDSTHMDEAPRSSILMELGDRVGVLHDVLKYFWKYDINVTRIESRPLQRDDASGTTTFDFYLDFDGTTQDKNVQKLLSALKPIANKVLILDSKDVYWFPRHISELDLIANRTLDAGVDLEADHPGFHDKEYRARRAVMAENAENHVWDQPIPRVQYTQEEKKVWSAVWDKMEGLLDQYACQEYLVRTKNECWMNRLPNFYHKTSHSKWLACISSSPCSCSQSQESMELMKKHCGYSRDDIPQQQDISEFLIQQSNFRMRPVAGLLSSRDFLNGLAFRVFFCTQYIRHHSKPLYTPEPDICHELLGHGEFQFIVLLCVFAPRLDSYLIFCFFSAPMFADRDFADFSQEIGLASLGASDDDVQKLAHCYWHSVEFGLCKQNGKNKAYGAGLLSSFGELEYACGDDHPGGETPPEIKPWDPEVAARQAFPITTYQPVYFLAESLHDAKQRMRAYCEGLQRPFFALHNAQTDTVHIDRPVKRTRGRPTEDNMKGD